MKRANKIFLGLILVLVFHSCIKWVPFDGRQLEPKYFSVFSESLNQVVFDHIAISSNGFFSDSKANKYLYKSDLIDTFCNRRMVLIHEWEESIIISSHIDTTYNSTENFDQNYLIVWSIDEGGVIKGAKRYNSKNVLIGIEDYVFEVNPVVYNPAYSDSWPGKVCWIREKTKYSGNMVLIEKKIYTYNEDGSVQIETILP